MIWCIGLYASASTWLFNVVRELAEADGKVRTHFFSKSGDVASFQAGVTNIVKSHEISDAGTVAELGLRATRIFVTIRDPRDAVTSLMLYHAYDFGRALDYVNQAARLCVRYAHDERTTLFTYESGFFDDPATPAKLAALLGLPENPVLAARIFAATRRPAVEQYISGLPARPGVLRDRITGDRLDPQTHWHTHHANRTGEIGRWKTMLTTEQIGTVEKKLEDCFNFE